MARKILVVDDQTINRELLKQILSKDYDVLEAESGSDALAILQKQHPIISAILLDIVMPGMDGFEVLKKIRESVIFKKIPVIVVTSLTDSEAEIKAVKLGAYGFVSKPYKPTLILHHLHNAISLRENSAIANAVSRDRLTRLYNQQGFFNHATKLIKDHEPGHYVLSCFDIDHFKVINDQYGTAVGDEVLKHVADTIKDTVEGLGGICCRIATDDFAMLFPASSLDSAQILESHQKTISPDCINGMLGIRIGRYLVEDPSLAISAMYDRAMLAKESISGRYDVYIAQYDESMRTSLVQEQQIVDDMRKALAAGEFEVWFQPQYNHSTKALIGSEALARWRKPKTNDLIPPSVFIPIFERNRFVFTLDKYIWEESCRFLRKWIDQGLKPLPVSVNVSRRDIMHDDFLDTITGLVEKYDIPRDLLRLEITESAFASNTATIIDIVKQLIELGFTVEIDDFGSGYSSLNTLKDVPAQILKLDMLFLGRQSDSNRGGNIIESVVRMAKWLGMAVIAEGVETKEQADFLQSIGCLYVQGFYYAKPMPEAEYESLAKNIQKEEHLITLETVENLDNNSFWNPESMDTLIFNSYVGAAFIFEYQEGHTEMLRATPECISRISSMGLETYFVMKLDWTNHLDENDKQRLHEALERSRNDLVSVKQDVILKNIQNFEQLFINLTMRVIAVAGNRYLVYCTYENLTAQREAERQERIAFQRMQAIMKNASSGVYAIALEGDTPTRLFANNKYFELLGYTEAQYETEGIDFISTVHPDDRALVEKMLSSAVKVGDSQTLDCRIVTPHGETRWLKIALNVSDFEGVEQPVQLSVYSDITAEKAVDELQRQLLDNLPGGAGIYTLKDGQMNLVYQNKSYWELVGLNEEAFPDTRPMSAIHPDDVPIIMQEMASAIGEGRDVRCNIRLRHLTEGFRSVRLAGRILPGEDGGLMIYATFNQI